MTLDTSHNYLKRVEQERREKDRHGVLAGVKSRRGLGWTDSPQGPWISDDDRVRWYVGIPMPTGTLRR